MKNYKKRIKNSLYVLSLLFVILVICYLISSCSKLKDRNISYDSINGKVYQTFDNVCIVTFFDDSVKFEIEGSSFFFLISYEENIIKLYDEDAAGQELYFIVLDENTLFSDKYNKYLYHFS